MDHSGLSPSSLHHSEIKIRSLALQINQHIQIALKVVDKMLIGCDIWPCVYWFLLYLKVAWYLLWSGQEYRIMSPYHKHDDVIKWKHFLCYWPFVRGIRWPRWIPRTKARDAELWCFFILRLNKWLSKQPLGWWLETLSHPLWRHRNDFCGHWEMLLQS